jgi:O-antigen/teichoic acid export membrane protein
MAFKRNLVANYVGQGWIALMNLAFIPFYIKYLGIEAYGLIGMFAILQACLSLLDLGMTPTLGREMARFTGGGHSNESIRDLLRSIEVVSFSGGILIAISVALSSDWIVSSWLNNNTLSYNSVNQAIILMGFVASLRFMEAIYRSAIVGLQRQVLFNLISAVFATFRNLGALIVLVFVKSTIEAFFIWHAFISIFALTILVLTTYQCLPKGKRNGRFSTLAIKGIWRFAGGMMIISILSIILTQLDKVLLLKLLSLEDFGYYTLAATIGSGLIIFIQPIIQAIYPRLCELYEKNDKVKLYETFHEGAQMVTISTGAVAIVVIFFSDDFLMLWSQDENLTMKVSYLLKLLMFGNLLNALVWIPYQLQLANGWTSFGVINNVVAICFVVPALLLLVPIYGAHGAAWIWITLNLGYCLISVQLMFRKILITEKWKWYLQDVLMPLSFMVLSIACYKYLSPINPTLFERMIIIIGAILLAIFSGSCVPTKSRHLIYSYTKKVLNSSLKSSKI